MIIITYYSAAPKNSEKYLLEKGAVMLSQQTINGKILTEYELPGCRVNTFENPDKSRRIDNTVDLDRIVFKGEREKQEAVVFAHVLTYEFRSIKNVGTLKPANPAKPQ
jgi:hypothetical protein